jgi:hypothetical protein
MDKIFHPYTLKLKYIPYKPFLFTCIFLLLIVGIIEVTVRIKPVKMLLPAPTIGKEIRFPEIDIKFDLLQDRLIEAPIDCFLVGSSMVDAGIDPQILMTELHQSNNGYRCFNFGLSGGLGSTSGVIARFVTQQYAPRLLVFGTSALDYYKAPANASGVSEIPWLQYHLGHNSFEGFLVDSFMVYRYFLTDQKMRQQDYLNQYEMWQDWLDKYGFRDWLNSEMAHQGMQEIYLTDFKFDSTEFSGLQEIVALKKKGVEVIVVEMPVHPKFAPYYMEGGVDAYNELFIRPISQYLLEENIPFIQTQTDISEIVAEDGWYNRNHLNSRGAKQFTAWLGKKISDYLKR